MSNLIGGCTTIDIIKDTCIFSTSDLVIWLTLELHHIPHTEDLPVTTTAGMDVSFYLQPYNYFPDDPAMASHNAVRMEPMGMRDIHI